MNHQLWNRVGARVVAAMFVVAAAAACSDDETRVSDAATATPSSTSSGSSTASTRVASSEPRDDSSLAARAERSGLPPDASPSAVVIGTPPAPPTPSEPNVTPPEGARSVLSAREQSMSQPNEGDVHSYSTVSPSTPQKSGNVDPVAMDSNDKEARK